MSKQITPVSANQSGFIDTLLNDYKLKNDAALARELGVQPPVISKIRNGVLGVGATMVLSIHERFGRPVADIRRELAA